MVRADRPEKKKRRRSRMSIRRELIDELLKDYDQPQDILGEGGLLKELTKAVVERCLETELDTHLGYPKHARKGNATGNTRNGQSQKTLKGEQGHVDIEVPRDRQGTFEPQLIKKGQTRFEGFDEKILALYARGMTTRDIQAQLQELYGVEVSATLISNVTEAVMDEVRLWMLTIATRRGRRRALTGPLPVHEMCHWSI